MRTTLIVALCLIMHNAAMAQVTFHNRMPYRSFKDSPFNGISYHYFYLEDFEDGRLNTPGVQTKQRVVVIGNSGYRTRLVDSVDEDDGHLDGSGSYGHSLWSDNNSSLGFSFDENVLGMLPTHVGIVWTDSPFAVVSLAAFDRKGDLIGQTNPLKLGDHSMTGTVTEDCFLGVQYKEGIAKIVIDNRASDFEIDHLQYGSESPCRECNREGILLDIIPAE